MTVGHQVKNALASLKSASASFEQFALQTNDQNAKQLYANAAEQTKIISQDIEDRVQQIEQEEPQFKGYQ